MDKKNVTAEAAVTPNGNARQGAAMARVQSLSHTYRMGEVENRILQNVDLEIRRGEFMAMLGPSGCGKTTLLNLLGGLERPTSGTIEVDGMRLTGASDKELGEYRRFAVAFIFQFYNLLPNLTAEENIAAGLEILGLSGSEIRARAKRYLQAVGLEGQGGKFPAQLSGGMQQRVAIARALAKQAKLILADEPTGNLDQETGRSILDLIQRAHREHEATIFLITHDANVASKADRIVSIANGRIVPGGA
jgi:putative ABC transport system ATP-binding protein